MYNRKSIEAVHQMVAVSMGKRCMQMLWGGGGGVVADSRIWKGVGWGRGGGVTERHLFLLKTAS